MNQPKLIRLGTKINIPVGTAIIILLLAACSPTLAASSLSPTSTFASILPVPQSAPALVPGSSAARAYQTVQAYQDGFSVGKYFYVNLKKGEIAYLDQEDNILQVNDSQGRVMLESLNNDYYRFYAWEGGYSIYVGGGFIQLTAGNSYTQKKLSATWEERQKLVTEVRQISNDQQIGYILLLKILNNGSFTGYEAPIAFIDANGDEIVSIQELDTALSQLITSVNLVGKTQPALAEGFRGEINSAYSLINTGAITDAYLKIKEIEPVISSAVQAFKATKNGNNFVILIAVLVLTLVVVGFLSWRRQQMRTKQQRSLTAQTQTLENRQISQFKRISRRQRPK